ncbi:prolyl oligopeptidase family serine peptidase [Cupriavidus sp. WKF15]|uniref:alpha/beta hydrolase family protein n=1 Tax=Cupriavidus sp. WKF15 TaxID=3032282 RepID=UPI0023E2DBCC|nr:prolyl oligopeptidase family serine peptidase [Cupriavidus sp. WKF15]WER47348.1 prolyl oligopeptidase family serine peptidase [Cupriavidus sp. WKF15]
MNSIKRKRCIAALACLTLSAGAFAQSVPGLRGRLLDQTTTLRVSAGELAKLLGSTDAGRQLMQVAGTPACALEIVYFRYGTIGGANEITNASAALMIPSGEPACSGPRPTMLYAHGTTTYRNFNIADLAQTDKRNGDGASEGLAVAAMYAAQGYIVIASNYAGYSGSGLAYHPYLNAAQQSADMIDSLAAGRVAMGKAASHKLTWDSGKLFVTGYSQGGYVAMATHRALQAAGVNVTAASMGSGPYALGAMGDALVAGEVDIGATVFTTLIATSYQHAYGNLYGNPGDFYEPAYAHNVEKLLPSMTSLDALIEKQRLPATALFSLTAPAPQFAALTPPTSSPLAPSDLTPIFALGFGQGNLVRNEYRLSMLQDGLVNPDGAFPNATVAMAPAASPAHPLRHAFMRNDLRNWTPNTPVQLCGGHNDPTVFFFNATVEQAYWKNAKVPQTLTTVLDVDSSVAGTNDPYAAIKQGFANAKATLAAQAVAGGATDGGASAVIEAYHGDLVAPFCMAAARTFFGGF